MTDGNHTRKLAIAAAALAWQGRLDQVLAEHQRLQPRRHAGGPDHAPDHFRARRQPGPWLHGTPTAHRRGRALTPVAAL